MKGLLIIFVILSTVHLGTSVNETCCPQKTGFWSCCGNGPCNVFCCNCENGCNKPCPFTKRDVSFVIRKNEIDGKNVAFDRFFSIDLNNDNLISRSEAEQHLNAAFTNLDLNNSDWYDEMDLNRDGFIQPSEFDVSLIDM